MNNRQLLKEGKELIEMGNLLGGLLMIEEASANGSITASSFLGFGFYIGKYGLPNDYVMAERYLLFFISQASPNNPDYSEAHFFLGCIYSRGEAGKKDIKKALYHYKISAELGHPIAEYYHNKITDKRGDRRLKWIVMPLIFLCIFGVSWLSSQYGLNQTLGGLISVILTIVIVLVFIYYDKKDWLDLPKPKDN